MRTIPAIEIRREPRLVASAAKERTTMVTLRLATARDAPALADIYRSSVEDSCISFEAEAPAGDEMARRLATLSPVAPWLVAVEEGSVLGYAYAQKHRDRAAYRFSADASVYVAQVARRRGVARSLYTALFQSLRLQGYFAVHAGVTLPNPASVGLHEALGFLPVGVYPAVGFKLGRWCDVGWWQLELAPRVAPPPGEPLPVEAARQLPGWRALVPDGVW
jgi:phosphinothricin acetyltransferase